MADFKVPIHDHRGDVSDARFPVADAVLDATLTAFFASIDDMTVGNLGQSTLEIGANKDNGPGGKASDKKAQVELKWLCAYHDASIITDEYTLEMPCADASLLAANTENMDLGAGAGMTFKGQFEAVCVAPRTGNAVVLDSAILVGRNL